MIKRALSLENLHFPMSQILASQLDAAAQHLEARQDRHKSAGIIGRALQRIHTNLNRPWRFAILGELNSGKTTLANMLLGDVTLPAKVISNTRIPTLLHYSEKPQINVVFLNGMRETIRASDIAELPEIARIDVGLPIDILQKFELLDCPGISGSDWREISFDISHYHVDAAFWCTSSTAPWRKSELDCWHMLPERLQERGIIIITRKDQLDSENQHKVHGRLNYETRNVTHNGFLFLSTTMAASSTKSNSENLWIESGAQELDEKLLKLISVMQTEREHRTKQTIDNITNRYLNNL